MNLFAHNGVHHSTATEAAVHSLSEVILIILAVSVVIAGLLAASVFVLKKFAVIEIPIKDKEEE